MLHISTGKEFTIGNANTKTSTLKLSIVPSKPESCHSYPGL